MHTVLIPHRLTLNLHFIYVFISHLFTVTKWLFCLDFDDLCYIREVMLDGVV